MWQNRQVQGEGGEAGVTLTHDSGAPTDRRVGNDKNVIFNNKLSTSGTSVHAEVNYHT